MTATRQPEDSTAVRSGPSFSDTDVANARRLIDRFGAWLRFTVGLGWFIWLGTRWAPDTTNQILRWAEESVRLTAEEALADGNADLVDHARKSEALARLTAMIELASADSRVVIEVDQLDADPDLLNVQNGAVDLRTGALLSPDPSRLLTKQCRVPYDPHAACPLWKAFLWRMFGGNNDLIEFGRSPGEC